MTTCSTSAEQKCNYTSFPRLRLFIRDSGSVDCHRLLSTYTQSIVALVPFTNLHINLRFSIANLIHYLSFLPDIGSLTITSQSSVETEILSEDQTNLFHSLSINNKITAVELEQTMKVDQLDALMNLCSQMQYLQVKCSNITDIEWLIPYILKKRNTNSIPHLSSICLCISNANENMVNNLQKIIASEKLIENYTIKRVCDKIYFRWNEHL
jgi:hypothetical protein